MSGRTRMRYWPAFAGGSGASRVAVYDAPTAVRHPAEQPVVEVPGGVRREVHRVGPAARGGDTGGIGDGETDAQRLARDRGGRHVDRGHLQVGGWRQLD